MGEDGAGASAVGARAARRPAGRVETQEAMTGRRAARAPTADLEAAHRELVGRSARFARPYPVRAVWPRRGVARAPDAARVEEEGGDDERPGGRSDRGLAAGVLSAIAYSSCRVTAR